MWTAAYGGGCGLCGLGGGLFWQPGRAAGPLAAVARHGRGVWACESRHARAAPVGRCRAVPTIRRGQWRRPGRRCGGGLSRGRRHGRGRVARPQAWHAVGHATPRCPAAGRPPVGGGAGGNPAGALWCRRAAVGAVGRCAAGDANGGCGDTRRCGPGQVWEFSRGFYNNETAVTAVTAVTVTAADCCF